MRVHVSARVVVRLQSSAIAGLSPSLPLSTPLSLPRSLSLALALSLALSLALLLSPSICLSGTSNQQLYSVVQLSKQSQLSTQLHQPGERPPFSTRDNDHGSAPGPIP